MPRAARELPSLDTVRQILSGQTPNNKPPHPTGRYFVSAATFQGLLLEQFDFTIPSASAVWDFVKPTWIHISRRPRGDKLVYVEILAGCRWDIEHGLVVIYRSGSTLSRVSERDGHLTTSDAFGFPEERDTIIYDG